MSDVWEDFDGGDVQWLQIGGKDFVVRIETFEVLAGWASWRGDNGDFFGAPVDKIEAVQY